MSSAHSLASRLMDLVARAAARSCAPTWSTPGSPCSARRSAASEVSAPLVPGTGGAVTPVSTAPDGPPPVGLADPGAAVPCTVVAGRHRRYLLRPGSRTTESLAARAVANPGLITVLMMCSRSSK